MLCQQDILEIGFPEKNSCFILFLEFLFQKVISSSAAEKNVHIVLGNESCDLDSVVSALCLSLLLYHEGKQQVLPVLNIPQEELPLRTEVNYLLRENDVPVDLLIFR